MGRHIITGTSWFGWVALLLYWVHPATAQVDQQRAEAYFREADTLCQRDGGRLWGLCKKYKRDVGDLPWRNHL